MCILLNVKKHEKTFALNVDIFTGLYKKNLIFRKNHDKIITLFIRDYSLQ